MARMPARIFAAVVTLSLFTVGCPPSQPDEGMGEGVQDAADRFFVDGNRGNDDNDGRRANPLETIGEAIGRASDLGGSVYVAGGDYFEPLILQSAVHIFGGYNPDTWLVDRENFPTTVMDSSFLAFAAVDVTDATLEGFNLMSSNPSPVESAYGVALLTSADITLRDLTISAGDGPPGENGEQGTRGGSGTPGGNGLTAAACGGFLNGGTGSGGRFGPEDVMFLGGDGGTGNLGDGSPGEDGHPGDENIPVAPGGAGGDAGLVGQDGSDGEPGTPGAPGAPGAGGMELGEFSSGGEYLPPRAGTGGQGGFGGAGGGGGGGGGAVVFACGGSGGGGGGPAFGGQGSAGGEGGHASFGVFVFESANINITNCTVATGNGGNGGDGGSASLGGESGAGGLGGARVAAQGSGGNGGAGGAGGPGGPGGGGMGGPVFGIAYDVSSDVTINNTTILLGEPGLGGMSVAGPVYFGADGQAFETFEFTPQPEEMP